MQKELHSSLVLWAKKTKIIPKIVPDLKFLKTKNKNV